MTEIVTIILAAGRGTRFGPTPKLLAALHGRPLIRHVADAASAAGLGPVIVVLGAHAEAVRAALRGLDVTFIHNERYADGLSTSLRAGVSAVPDAEAALVMLGDMPLVRPSSLARLAEAYRAADTAPAAVVPLHGGRRGNPVLLNLAALRDEIADLTGDRGAGPLLARRIDVIEIEGDVSTSLDIDTPDALAAVGP